MRLRRAGLVATIAFACTSARSRGEPTPNPTTHDALADGGGAGARGATMKIDAQDLPDAQWKQAADVALATWKQQLVDTDAATVVVRPWKSPAGDLLPYLIEVAATASDGSPGFRAIAAVTGGAMVNRTGAGGATKLLAGAGFPRTHVALGHLLDALFLTAAVEPSWLSAPSVVGWDRAVAPGAATQLAPAVEYGKDGAVLHLYRAVGAGGGARGGPGAEEQPVERLDVAFDAKAGFTTTVLRQAPGHGAWAPVH